MSLRETILNQKCHKSKSSDITIKSCKVSIFSLIVFVTTILSILYNVHGASHPHIQFPDDYSYNPTDYLKGPTAWRGECLQGYQQSPIDIRMRGFGIKWGYTKVWFDSNYQKTHKGFYIANKGYTVQVQFNNDKRNPDSNLVISGAGFEERYVFSNLHFHWGDRDEVGSEHTLQGQRYPMELHFVHYKARYDNLTHALHESSDDHQAVQVLSVLFQFGDENKGLIPIVQSVKTVLEPLKKLHYVEDKLNLLKLLPRELDFVRYVGSLTTPPCTEKVAWTVFTTPVAISHKQMTVFRSLKNSNGTKGYYNFRPIQPRHGRSLKYYKVLGWSSGVSYVTTFAETFSNTFQGVNSLFHSLIRVVCGKSLCGFGRIGSRASDVADHINEHRTNLRRPFTSTNTSASSH